MASSESGTEPTSTQPPPGAAKGLAAQIRNQTSRLADLGLSKAAEFADEQRQSGVQTVDSVANVIHEFADAAGGQFGEPVAGVVHRGGDAIAALARGLEDRSIEDLVEQTRSTILRHPGAAIAAASVVGFVAGRIVKGGLARDGEASASENAGSSKKEFAA